MLGTVFSFSKTGDKVYAASAVKASAAYLDLDGSGNILNGFEGGQKENIYFGSYEGSPAKWLVLSKNDKKYGSGNNTLLLFAEDIFYTYYAQETNQTYLAFYGTSYARAKLNGGWVANKDSVAGNITNSVFISNGEALISQLFDEKALSAVITMDELVSHNAVNIRAATTPEFRTVSTDGTDTIYTTNDEKWNGNLYNTDAIGATSINTKTGVSDGNNNFSVTFSEADGVTEILKGDKLFMLDYMDINNRKYGFVDSDNKTYLESIFPDVASQYYDGNGDIIEDNYRLGYYGWFDDAKTKYYYGKGFNVESARGYWLRSAGIRTDNAATSWTQIMQNYDNTIAFGNAAKENDIGYRPAFVLDTTKIAYATSKSPSISTSFTQMTATDTPTYKIYQKSNDYNAFSAGAACALTVDGNNLKVTYNNPTFATPSKKVTEGNILLLLTEKGSTDGAVAYQAAATLSASAETNKTAVANFSLAGIDFSQYDATVLLTSVNGGEKTETIYCSYATSGNVAIPHDINNLTYDGQSKWVPNLSEKPDWYDANLHNNDKVMTVKSIAYTSMAQDATATALTAEAGKKLTDLIVDAGKYEITMHLADGLKWNTGDSDDKTFTMTIGKKESSVEAVYAAAPTYVPDELPEITLKAGGTEGTIKWDEGQVPKSGTNNYTWTFKPKDENNYTEVTGSKSFNFAAREIESVTIKLFDTKGKTVYTNTTETTLKSYMTVEVKFVSFDKTEILDPGDYELLINANNKLKAGENKLKAKYTTSDNKSKISAEFTISGVVELSYKSITQLTLSNDEFTYPVKASEILAEITAVSVEMNDGSSGELTADEIKSLIEVSGDLTVGTKDITFKIKDTEAETEYPVTIKKGTYKIDDSLFADKTVTYSGSAFDPDGWIDESKLPEGVSVTYSCETDLTAVGEHTVKATFTTTDNNYNNPAEMTAKLTITDKKLHDMSGVTVEGTNGLTVDGKTASATYNKSSFEISVGSLPTNVTVKDTIYEKKQADGTYVAVDGLPTDAGEYRVKVSFETDDPEYATPDDLVIDLTIGKANVDMTGVTFEDDTVTYNGEAHGIFIGGEPLPEWITVTYEGNGVSEVGSHTVTAKFAHSNPNYNAIADMTATLTISDAVVTGVVAKLEEGATFTADNTLEDLKAKLTAEIEYNNGTKETLKPEDFEVTCNGLRENGKFKAGIQSVTVKYGDFETVVNLTVNKVKVAVPTFKGGLSYTGIAVKPTVENFNGYDAEIMTFVTDKTLSGLNAGSYKAVFALNDIENYEWATASAMNKSLFAVTLYDEEIPLVAGETAVDWTLSKAKITATTSEGALPVFASESYKGALSGIVGLKYYKDEACTEEIAADELGYETTYYVKAELLDGDNFELDTSAAELTVAPVPYTTPAKELTFWEKVVVFLKANWLWLVIAVVALILLITIIALAVRASKKKRKREERRLAEEKEERKREQEERRLEREERMARLSQQQAAPQPQYIPQPMPQMMPQMQMPMAQPMAQQGGMAMGGGVSEAQFMQMQAELAALKAEQSTVKEIAALRAEVMKAELSAKESAGQQIEQSRLETQLASILARLGGEQVVANGITLDKLTELVEKTVEKVLDGREKASAQVTASDNATATPATTQVPPDAVMTTVTTTKIDTTKKPVQSTNDRAPVGRPIVRNYVAPMPVDDGRVFDVGGFYKPADPVTDLGITDDEDKKD